MNTFDAFAAARFIVGGTGIYLHMMSYEYLAVFFAGAAAFGLTAFLGGVRKRGAIAVITLNILFGLFYSVAEVALDASTALSCFVSGYGGITGQFVFSLIGAIAA